MVTYKVIAKDDLQVLPHTWTKGLDYQVVEKSDYFILASNEGSLNYYNTVRDQVFENFEVEK